MLRTSILLTMFALAAFATGCGPTVKEACENAAEQCMLEQADTDECISEGETLEEDDKVNDDALDCLAEAASCDEVEECPEIESAPEDDATGSEE